MRSKIRTAVITIILLLIVSGLYIGYMISEQTIFNEGNVTGNTAGNLYNGGLFCMHGDLIYFSNFRDEGGLYSMDIDFQNVKKISDDKPRYINVDDNYIYYSRYNYMQSGADNMLFKFYNYGLYRIRHDGSKCTLLTKELTGQTALYGNYLYYQKYDKTKGLWFYKVKIDGSDDTFLSKDYIYPGSFNNGLMYYAPSSGSDDHFLRTYNPVNDSFSLVTAANMYMPIYKNDYIYYINLDENYNLYRMSIVDKEPEPLVKEFVSTYNISDDGHTLYYQIDGGKDNRLAMLNIINGTQTTIIDGDYKAIHVINKYVFFLDYNESTTYMYDSLTKVVNKFSAPVIDKE